MIDEELTNTFGDDIDAEVAKLNELLKKSGSSATIERYPYGTALCIKESLTNTRGAGRKEIEYSAIKISFFKRTDFRDRRRKYSERTWYDKSGYV